MSKALRIVEVGPRDGMQNEANFRNLPQAELVDRRVQFIVALAKAGIQDVEAGAFVRTDKIPQMAATDQVLAKLQQDHPTLWQQHKFWTLVPNRKGLEFALQAKAKHIAVFTATSDDFNKKNIGMSVQESLKEIKPIITEAKQNGMQVRGYVSTVWGCPYQGQVDPNRALQVSNELLNMGAEEISLGDTIGVATPMQVSHTLNLFQKDLPLAVHFHDTRGTALANTLRAIDQGINIIDSSAGGLGGCPYAKGASGNLATEDLLYMLAGMPQQTNIDIEKVCESVEQLITKLKVFLPSRYHQAWKAKSGSSPA